MDEKGSWTTNTGNVSEEENRIRNEQFEMGVKVGHRQARQSIRTEEHDAHMKWYGTSQEHHKRAMETMRLSQIYYIATPVIMALILFALLFK